MSIRQDRLDRLFTPSEQLRLHRVRQTEGTKFADVRAEAAKFGKTLSRDRYTDLNEIGRRLDRGLGYNVKSGGRSDIRDSSGRLKSLAGLPPRKRLTLRRKPRPVVIPGARMQAEVALPAHDSRGRYVGDNIVAVSGESVAEMLANAKEAIGEGDGYIRPGGVAGGPVGPIFLNVRYST